MKRKNHFWLIALVALIIAIVPQLAFATEQGAVAEVNYDDDNNSYYQTINQMQSSVNRTSSTAIDCYLGTVSSSGSFARSKNITSAEVVITKDSEEVGREKVEVGEIATSATTINGIDYGYRYEVNDDTNAVKELSGFFWLELTNDSPLYYTDLTGKYNITFNWTAAGTDYSKTISYTLNDEAIFSGFYYNRVDDEGYPLEWWGSWTNGSNNEYEFAYNDIEAYSKNQYDWDSNTYKDVEAVKTFIYSDSSINGVFDFVSCDTEGYSSIFTAGDEIAFSKNVKVKPVYVHPNNITQDMIGKSCVLTFKNGGTEKKITIKITKANNSFLNTGKMYVIDESYIGKNDDGSVGVYLDYGIEIEEYNYNDWISENLNIEVEQDELYGSKYVFVTYKNGKLYPVELAELSEEQAEILDMTTKVTEDGVYYYQLRGISRGNVNLTTSSGTSISCNVSLPDEAIFSTNAHNQASYINELHYANAKESSGDEVYFYLMVKKPNTNVVQSQSDIKVGFMESYLGESGNWENRYYDVNGITFTPLGTTTDGATYYVWKMTITKEFSSVSDDQDYVLGCIAVYAGDKVGSRSYESYQYSGYVNINMYDATEILADQQLYQYSADDDLSIDKDGKIYAMVANEDEESGEESETTSYDVEIYVDSYIGFYTTKGSDTVRFAIKKGDYFYAVNSEVTVDASGDFFVTKTSDYDYLLDWRSPGRYLLSTSMDEVQYYANVRVMSNEPGLYYKNIPDDKWRFDIYEFYFNDAYEKSADGSEAYFYVMTKDTSLYRECGDPVLKEFNSETGSYERVELDETSAIKIGPVEKIKSGDDTYYSWKVTVTKDYDDSVSPNKHLVFESDGEIWGDDCSVNIYDSSEPAATYGNIDWDVDESVNFADVLCLKRYIAGWPGYNGYNLSKRIADLNRDGVIDAGDIMILERHIAGWKKYKTLPKTA